MTAPPACGHDTSECWRPAHEHAGYDVSCQGRVRTWKSSNGRRKPLDQPRMLAQRRKDNNYLEVSFSRGNGKGRATRCKFYVHRAVLLAFEGVPVWPETFAAHLNADRGDNRLRNLKWVTKAENEAHKKAPLGTAAGRQAGFWGSEPRETDAPF